MSGLLQDLRYAIRGFARSPAFTCVAVATIALGIGVNTAIFSVVDDVLLRPLRLADEARIVQITERTPAAPLPYSLSSLLNFEEYRDRTTSFDQVAALGAPSPVALYVAGDSRPIELNAFLASSTLLPMLRVEPVRGRTFEADADRPGGPQQILLSEAMWRRLYDADPDAIGSTLTSLSPPGDFTIVGILPPGFEVPPVTHSPTGGYGGKGLARRAECDAIVSVSLLPPNFLTNPNARRFQSLAVLGRLKDGVDLAGAQADIDLTVARIAEADPYFASSTATVTPLVTVLRRAYGRGLFFLWATSGIALMIVCVNVAGFLLVRGVERERELSIRMALGCGRRRLVQQLMTESLALGAVGGIAGIALAVWAIQLLKQQLPSYMYRLDEARLDPVAVIFAVVATLLATVLFGLLPALQVVRPRMFSALKDGTRATGGRRARLLGTMVAAEVALAVVLLSGAGLMVVSYWRLTAVDIGLQRENLLAVEAETLPYNLTKYRDERSWQIEQEMLATVGQVPGVVAVAGVSRPPLGLFRGVTSFTLADRPPPEEGEVWPSLDYESVTSGYFATMGIPLLTGRDFTDEDRPSGSWADTQERYRAADAEERARMREEAWFAVVINDVMARRYWPDGSPIGKQLYFGQVDLEQPPLVIMTIVGVVAEVKTKSISEAPRAQAYIQASWAVPWLMIRTRADSAATVEAIRSAIDAIDPEELAVVNVTSMDDLYGDATADGRSQMSLIVASATLGTFLAAIGLFGVMAYSVARRTHEIGIRLSLGATPNVVVAHVVRRGMRLAAVGLVVGLAASVPFTRSISGLLFEVSPIAPGILASVVALLGVVAMVACYVPARRASRVDPVEALRRE